MKIHGGRALLNRAGHESTAAFVAEIECTDGADDDYLRAPHFTLQIANCDRSMAFDLRFDTAADRRNNLHKVDTMIKLLVAFRAGLEIEHKRFVARQRRLGGS